MPLNIDVYVNETRVKEYRIGRVKGTDDPHSIGTYSILSFAEGEETVKKWSDGQMFEHRYSDGIDVCVKKGLVALLADAPPPPPPPKNPFKAPRPEPSQPKQKKES